jgi:glycosyltransferase involved in cell wall biosynthesis
VSHLLVHSPVLRDQLIALGAKPERVTCLPMPMDPAPLTAVDPAPLMRRLDLAGKRPLVLLGFLARRKGYDVALQALRELPEEYVLVAAGGEHQADTSGTEAWLQNEVRQAGLSHRVRITGYLPAEELEQAAALAEVVLAPFREMSASASLSYALARGKAVIASDLEPNRLLSCVRLFPQGNASALAAAVRAVTETPGIRLELERAALRHAENHSYSALAEETIGLYNQLLAVDAR